MNELALRSMWIRERLLSDLIKAIFKILNRAVTTFLPSPTAETLGLAEAGFRLSPATLAPAPALTLQQLKGGRPPTWRRYVPITAGPRHCHASHPAAPLEPTLPLAIQSPLPWCPYSLASSLWKSCAHSALHPHLPLSPQPQKLPLTPATSARD